MTDFERLNTEGFQLTGRSIRGFTLRASYGDGYAEGAVIGSPEGLRSWRVKIAALPDIEGMFLIEAGEHGLQTRARYLWEFFIRHNVAAAHKPFWLRDEVEKKDFLAEIVEEELDFDVFCTTVFGAGLTLRQRRVSGVEGVGAVTEEVNPDAI